MYSKNKLKWKKGEGWMSFEFRSVWSIFKCHKIYIFYRSWLPNNFWGSTEKGKSLIYVFHSTCPLDPYLRWSDTSHLIHISDGEWHIDGRRNHPIWTQVRCNKYMHKWQERGWWCRGVIKSYFRHAKMSGHVDIESDIHMLCVAYNCNTQLHAKPWTISGFFL
jgi:hypothetical protein